MGLLRQPAGRRPGARCDLRRAPGRRRAGPSCRRLPRHHAACRYGDRPCPADQSWRYHLPVGLAGDHQPGCCGGGARRRVRRGRAPCLRTGPTAPTFPQPRVRCHRRGWVRRRVRDVRSDHLSPAVPPNREGHRPDRLRTAAPAADGRPAADLDRQRSAHQPHRPVQGLPCRGDRAHHRRPVPALHAGRGLDRTGDVGCDVRVRPRPGRHHAGVGDGGAKRGRIPRSRHRHLRGDVLPVDRRKFRSRRVRHDFRQHARR